MEKYEIDILAKRSGKTSRTVFRALKELDLPERNSLSPQIVNLIIIYIRIDAPNQIELRRALKEEILKILNPDDDSFSNSEFKQYLLKQNKQKDKQLKRKDKDIQKFSDTIVGLTNKMIGLLDDLSMLRIQDTGTVQRLHDKNVLADLLMDLDPGSDAHTSIRLLLDRMNKKN